VKVTETAALDEAISKAMAYKGPALVEIITDAELI
jgi:thiamine pyrophosphate-dependent acetolactate synthase large subunit-like protein